MIDFSVGDRVRNRRSGTHAVVNSIPRDETTHPDYRTITVYIAHPNWHLGNGRYARWRRVNVEPLPPETP